MTPDSNDYSSSLFTQIILNKPVATIIKYSPGVSQSLHPTCVNLVRLQTYFGNWA